MTTDTSAVSGGTSAAFADSMGLFVVASTIVIDEAGCERLEEAFQDRLGAVEGFDGFRGLQVWREPRKPGEYLMVSWWASRDQWATYMRSSEHDASHARIPTAPARPHAAGVRIFEVVAT